MAINWKAWRQPMEINAPPTVDGVTAFEGGIVTRHDDATDMVRYTFYVLINKAGAGAGTYVETWQVQNPDKTALQNRQAFNINEAVPSGHTEMLLLTPGTAVGHANYRSVSIGAVAPDAVTENNILAGLRQGDNFPSTAIDNEFAAAVTRTVFVDEVAGSIAQAEFV